MPLPLRILISLQFFRRSYLAGERLLMAKTAHLSPKKGATFKEHC
jgi:hypothetical protein